MRVRTAILSLAISTLIAVGGLALAQAPANQSKSYALNFVDVDITVLAELVAAATGKKISIDPDLHRTVTLISARPLTAAEMYAAFKQVLDVNGYSAIERGDTVRIVSRGRIEI